MQIGTQERGKLIALLALAAICSFFVYRNFFLPEEPRVPASLSAESNTSGDADSVPGLGLCILAKRASASAVDGLFSLNFQHEAAVELPTLGEWGMLFATLSLLAAGTTVIIRRRRP